VAYGPALLAVATIGMAAASKTAPSTVASATSLRLLSVNRRIVSLLPSVDCAGKGRVAPKREDHGRLIAR
jgi:hypothetical protein